MKVLFVNTSDTVGGAARAANRIRNGVESLGVLTQMFVKDKNSEDSSVVELYDFIPKNFCFMVFDWCAKKAKNKWQHYKWRAYKDRDKCYMSDLRSTAIHGALQELDYDILHLHWINLRFLDINELKKVKKPIVWTLHDAWPFCGVCHYFLDCDKYQTHCGRCYLLNSSHKKDLSYEVFEKKKRAYKGLNLHIVAPSQWLADSAKKSALFCKFPVSVIPNCIDTDVFAPKPERDANSRWLTYPDIELDKFYLLFGAMNAVTDKIKGFSELLRALRLFEREFDCSNLELLVFGADKPIEEYDINIPVRYLGYIVDNADMSLLYSLADVTVVPSLTENLSCTIMESLACGTPVCCFDIGGNGDMVEHRSNGYLAKEKDCDDLAKGIQECICHSREWGLAARESVLKKYSVGVVAEQYAKLYEELAK